MKPKRGSYEIALVAGGKEPSQGWVCGDYAMRKERYFWEYTHTPTGVKVNVSPPLDTLAPAKQHLIALAEGRAPQCKHVEDFQAREACHHEWEHAPEGLTGRHRCRERCTLCGKQRGTLLELVRQGL